MFHGLRPKKLGYGDRMAVGQKGEYGLRPNIHQKRDVLRGVGIVAPGPTALPLGYGVVPRALPPLASRFSTWKVMRLCDTTYGSS